MKNFRVVNASEELEFIYGNLLPCGKLGFHKIESYMTSDYLYDDCMKN